MKLNLGCGTDIQSGYVNIDARSMSGVDLTHDIEQKDLPYAPGTVSEVRAIDVLEHFSFRSTERILRDWFRVLKLGGFILVQVPNIEQHIELFYAGVMDKRGRYTNGYDDAIEYFRANVFGGQDYPENTHKTCFTPASLSAVLSKVGFVNIAIEIRGRALIGTAAK
jgi:predicted SAM-dependent methyltransferase